MRLKPTVTAAAIALFSLGLASTAAQAAPEKAPTARQGKKAQPKRSKAPRQSTVRETSAAPKAQDQPEKGRYRDSVKRNSRGHFQGIPALNGEIIRPRDNSNPFDPNAMRN